MSPTLRISKVKSVFSERYAADDRFDSARFDNTADMSFEDTVDVEDFIAQQDNSNTKKKTIHECYFYYLKTVLRYESIIKISY